MRTLDRFDREQKAAVLSLYQRWKGTGTSIGVLTESLRILTSPGTTGTYFGLLRSHDPHKVTIASVIVVNGRGYSPKGALPSSDATLVLGLIEHICETVHDQSARKRAVELAITTIFGDASLDGKSDTPRVRELIGRVFPSALQLQFPL